MVLTPSTMVPLGTQAPAFELPDTDGSTVRLSDFEGSPLVVTFLCNHCPYVKRIANGWAHVAKELQDDGVAVVAINSNDARSYPEDSPERMREEKRRRGYTFPYLYDELQDVARAYQAACTPDFFLYDADHRLVYRGQLDTARPNNDDPVDGRSLRAAVQAMRGEGEMPPEVPSMGCNIKWRR